MSSFNYNDDFSSFNDLINRAEFLTEARKYGDYHKSFSGVRGTLWEAGRRAATLDTITFIRTLLYNLSIISHDEMLAAKRGSGIKGKGDNLLALLDAKKKEVDNNTDEIAAAVEEGLAEYINRTGTDRGKKEKYAAQAAADKLAKDIKAGKDVGDAVEVTAARVGQLKTDDAEVAAEREGDKTTMFAIKIADPDKGEEVKQWVSKYADDHLDVFEDTVNFSASPDSGLVAALNNLTQREGRDVAEHQIIQALKRDLSKIVDVDIEIYHPEEDYEQIDDNEEEGPSMANYPGGRPSSYSANEIDDSTTPENEEDWIQKAVDPEHEGYCTPMSKPTCTPRRKAFARTMKKMAKERKEEGNEELGIFLTKEEPEDDIPVTDYEGILDDLIDRDKEERAIKRLSVEDEEYRYSPMLDSYQTSTAGYLTEQTSSDKRNKKSEVKNQSFKERYKPKTNRQLEELRRYGL